MCARAAACSRSRPTDGRCSPRRRLAGFRPTPRSRLWHRRRDARADAEQPSRQAPNGFFTAAFHTGADRGRLRRRRHMRPVTARCSRIASSASSRTRTALFGRRLSRRCEAATASSTPVISVMPRLSPGLPNRAGGGNSRQRGQRSMGGDAAGDGDRRSRPTPDLCPPQHRRPRTRSADRGFAAVIYRPLAPAVARNARGRALSQSGCRGPAPVRPAGHDCAGAHLGARSAHGNRRTRSLNTCRCVNRRDVVPGTGAVDEGVHGR